ncbi:MAG: METTL5 family protein [Candidatus Thermoplasmatota archaeon]|nr:METTL5 family protein [Candidatus Thermoplasmatota archaeon]
MIIDQKKLEILIQGLKGRNFYNNSLEQYDTDPSVVAAISYMARLNGDVEGKSVVDPGTGNGAFAYAAAVLGAERVVAVDLDRNAIEVASQNCKGLQVEFINRDIRMVDGSFDTCLMNPPWGSVQRGSDLPFLDFSVRSCRKIYSIHNIKGIEYVEKFFARHGKVVRKLKTEITIRKIYPHHENEKDTVEAVILVTSVPQNH